MENSITKLRKWNLVAGGSDPRNDVIPASVGYGLEEGLQFAVSEITRLEDRCKRLENIINQAWEAFFPHSSHREAAIAMHRILDEEVRKEAKP